jgi:hypothetical protein
MGEGIANGEVVQCLCFAKLEWPAKARADSPRPLAIREETPCRNFVHPQDSLFSLGRPGHRKPPEYMAEKTALSPGWRAVDYNCEEVPLA